MQLLSPSVFSCFFPSWIYLCGIKSNLFRREALQWFWHFKPNPHWLAPYNRTDWWCLSSRGNYIFPQTNHPLDKWWRRSLMRLLSGLESNGLSWCFELRLRSHLLMGLVRIKSCASLTWTKLIRRHSIWMPLKTTILLLWEVCARVCVNVWAYSLCAQEHNQKHKSFVHMWLYAYYLQSSCLKHHNTSKQPQSELVCRVHFIRCQEVNLKCTIY